jgi:hypothetical protein
MKQFFLEICVALRRLSPWVNSVLFVFEGLDRHKIYRRANYWGLLVASKFVIFITYWRFLLVCEDFWPSINHVFLVVYYFIFTKSLLYLCIYCLSNNLFYLNNYIQFCNILIFYQNIIIYLFCFLLHLFFFYLFYHIFFFFFRTRA